MAYEVSVYIMLKTFLWAPESAVPSILQLCTFNIVVDTIEQKRMNLEKKRRSKKLFHNKIIDTLLLLCKEDGDTSRR